MKWSIKSIDPGTQFHQLTVRAFAGSDKHRNALYHCDCECGKPIVVRGSSLRSGHNKSCGRCLHKTHGLRYSSVYPSWRQSIQRCYNSKHKDYHYYGGRGIRVCEFLRVSPNNLLSVLGDRPKGLTLDRIDNDLNYSCGQCAECLRCDWNLNVRWATSRQQNRNSRHNRWLTYNGVTKIMEDWANDAGIPVPTFHRRLKLGLDPFKNIHSKSQRAFEETKKG